MKHCNNYVAAYDSDEGDNVSVSDEEMDTGLQFIAENGPESNIGLKSKDKEKEKEKEKPKTGSGILSFFGKGLSKEEDAKKKKNEEELLSSDSKSKISKSDDKRKVSFEEEEEIVEQRLQKMQEIKKSKVHKSAVRKQKINYNIVSMDLASLGSAANSVATGEHFVCSNEKCKVILSEKDVLLNQDDEGKCDDDQKIWRCSFCNRRNVIDIDKEEIPKGETIDYILEPPTEEKNQDENLIIFAIDISGSMCVSMEVSGKLKLKGSDLSGISAFNEDNSSQFLPNQNQTTTWISRLQCVQAAINDQITEFAKNRPKSKIGLITFSSEVTIIGDGTSNPEFIAGDKLRNMEKLIEIGENYKFDATIDKSSRALIEKLYKLEENGQTALGPALVVAISMASQKAGSQVVLCTDGLANVGLGSLEKLKTDEEREEIAKWYENVGTIALQKGVTVNVISITDGDCKLENIGKVTDLSKGTVEKINPLNLKDNFKGILTKTLLATNVQATMFLHPALRFKKDHEELEKNELHKANQKELNQLFSQKDAMDIDVKTTTTTPNNNNNDNKNDDKDEKKSSDELIAINKESQDIGNVFEDTKIFFEYALLKEKINKDYSKLTDIPFQVQIHFKRLDGAKMLRIITQTKPITKDRKQVLDNLDMDIMAAHNMKKSARLCEEGDYESARQVTYSSALWMANNNNNSNVNFAKNKKANKNFVGKNMALDSMMQKQQLVERKDKSSVSTKSDAKEKMKSRKNMRDDNFSSEMYHSKK